jgi:hypothetical protein
VTTAATTILCSILGLLLQTTQPASTDADALARKVADASGAQHWPNVKRIQFTFNVESDGNRVAAVKHDWDVAAGKDTVTWKGQTVTVDLANPGEDEQQKQAFGRWTNDAYWLLMPLKLFDGGVTRTIQPDQEVDGKMYNVLRLSFAGVGLTPGDQYDLLIDPDTHHVRFWDYMPAPDKKSRFTWDDYKSFGPLTLSTEHKTADGKRRIFFTDVNVAASE